MSTKGDEGGRIQELQTISSVSSAKTLRVVCISTSSQKVANLLDDTYVAEHAGGKSCILAHRPIDVHNVEEAVLRVQGFLTNVNLPPVRQFK